VIVPGIAAGLAVLCLLALARSYNRFVDQRQVLENSCSNVDTELQRRHELVPNLVATVRGYAAHEKTTLDAVVQARQLAVGTPTGDAPAQNALSGAIRQLLALSEAYPDLRASEQFLVLQHELTRTENRLQASRRIFNGNVRDYNQRIDSFPSLLVAKLFGFSRSDYFELTDVPLAAGRPAGTR
jgi:LemA protein